MGLLIDGQWISQAPPRADRPPSTVCEHWIRRDGSTSFTPEPERYHLWVSTSCQWSRRVLIARSLLGLQQFVPISRALPKKDDHGWAFSEGVDDLQPDGARLPLHRVYTTSHPHYTGHATVPLLWDRKRETIVSNKTVHIVRMLITECEAFKQTDADLFPEDKREEIEWLNTWIDHRVRLGCVRVEKAKSPEAAAHAAQALTESMQRIGRRLRAHRYLVGDEITEADVLFHPFLTRFRGTCCADHAADPAPLAAFPEIAAYAQDLSRQPSFQDAADV